MNRDHHGNAAQNTEALQVRAEFFNALNTPHFGTPTANIQAPTAGKILATAGNPRQIQFALKLVSFNAIR